MIVCLLVPEFGSDLLDRPFFRDHPPGLRSKLVPSFPATTATLQATLRTGRPADEHGVLFEDDDVPDSLPLARAVTVDASTLTEELETKGDPRILVARWDGLGADRRGIVALEEALGRLFSGSEHEVMLVGAPNSAVQTHSVQLPVAELAQAGWRVRSIGSVALLEGPEPFDPDWKSRLLATPGVERVLTRRSLELWHAPCRRGPLLLAEPGWGFTDQAQTTGRIDDGELRPTPVLLGWPTRVDPLRSWPSSAHDWRIAPTLAEMAGVQGFDAFDAALAWPTEHGS